MLGEGRKEDTAPGNSVGVVLSCHLWRFVLGKEKGNRQQILQRRKGLGARLCGPAAFTALAVQTPLPGRDHVGMASADLEVYPGAILEVAT